MWRPAALCHCPQPAIKTTTRFSTTVSLILQQQSSVNGHAANCMLMHTRRSSSNPECCNQLLRTHLQAVDACRTCMQLNSRTHVALPHPLRVAAATATQIALTPRESYASALSSAPTSLPGVSCGKRPASWPAFSADATSPSPIAMLRSPCAQHNKHCRCWNSSVRAAYLPANSSQRSASLGCPGMMVCARHGKCETADMHEWQAQSCRTNICVTQ
jgi:hypothetical protein